MRDELPERVELTKVDAAVRQTEAAIAHFFAGDYDCCITLAGAAEGQLSEPPPDKPYLWGMFRSHFAAGPFKVKEVLALMNDTRDWLKHETKALPDFRGIARYEAEIMLVRAISKLQHHKHEESQVVRDCIAWARETGVVRAARDASA